MAKSTLYVAANDAPAADKARADYTCDGTADNTEIQAAITALQGQGGGAVLLSPGTFNLSTRITIAGAGDVDVEQDIMLMGTGPSNTTLALGTGQASAIEINACAKVHLHNFRIDLGSATSTAHGISSTAGNATAGYRSFWQSSFKNLTIVGDFASHSGYGLHLDSPFRSVFENIEVNGCGSGMRMYSTNTAFNPGDCVVQRCFMDVIGTNGFGYKIESTTADGNMNQIEFIMCEAIHSSTGGTGIYLGGTGPVNHTKWHGINLEQFDTLVNFNNGQGNQVNGNYWELRGATGLNGLVFGANAVDNEIERIGFWYVGTASNMISKAGGSATQPNIVRSVALFCDGAALALGYTGPANTPGTDTLLRKRISNGGGTSPGTNVLVAPGAVNF